MAFYLYEAVCVVSYKASNDKCSSELNEHGGWNAYYDCMEAAGYLVVRHAGLHYN